MDLFRNRTPSAAQAIALDTITGALTEAWEKIDAALPGSAEKTLAQRKLEEGSMWAKKAAVFTVK